MVSSQDEHVSLSVLDRTLRLVRVPRARLNECMHAVVRLLWFREAGDPFFSLTANELELSIFAEETLLQQAFGPLASTSAEVDSEIVIDDSVWLALQVEQHSEDWEASGARVKDISAPLAKEGISIMFLATRYSDFLICKEHRLPQVLRILQDNGFGFAAEPDANANYSGRTSPMRKRTSSPTRSSSVTGSLVLTRTMTASTTSSPVRPNSGSRDPMTSSIESLRLNGDERGRSRRSRTTTGDTLLSPESEGPSEAQDIGGSAGQANSPSPDMPRSFPKSDSTVAVSSLDPEIIATSLAILPDELVTVGLSCDHENVWREKLVRALFFCEDVLPPNDRRTTEGDGFQADDEAWLAAKPEARSGHKSTRPHTPTPHRVQTHHPNPESAQVATANADYPVPFFGFTQTVEGASLTADIRLLRALFSPSEEDNLVYATGNGGLSGEWLGEIVDRVKRTQQHNIDTIDFPANGVDQSRTLLKCLQLDLSQFGLDRHGIVNSFADILNDEGINLLYTSTFKTACVLVSKSDLCASDMSILSLFFTVVAAKARQVLAAHSSAYSGPC